MSECSFNVRPTRAYAGLILHRVFVSWFSIIVYTAALVPLGFSSYTSGKYLLLGIIIALIAFGFHIESLFIKHKLIDDEEKVLSKSNLGCYVTYEMVSHLHGRGHITLPKLLKAAAHTTRGKFILAQMGTTPKAFIAACLSSVDKKELVLPFMSEVADIAKELEESRIASNAVLLAFFRRKGVFTDFMNELDISIDDLETILRWEKFHKQVDIVEKFWEPQQLVRSFGTIGRSWSQGYTNDLDVITEDISGSVIWREEKRGVIMHEKELESTVQIISRASQRNALFIGKTGVGRHTMIENVTALLRKQEMSKGLPLTRIVVLNTEMLLSGVDHADKVLLRALAKAEKSGKFFLIVPNIAVFLRSAEGNLRSVFTKFLQSKNITICSVAAPEDYHTYVKVDPTLDSMFEKLYIDDTGDDETLAALYVEYFKLKRKYGVTLTYRTLNLLLDLTKRYINKGGLPGKAIDILSDSMVATRNDGLKVVDEEHIRKAISLKAHMDISEVSKDEKSKLVTLAEKLQTTVIGQEVAIDALVNTLKRARLDINAGKRAMGTFLFLGPTGVGKTYTAKILAKEYFGSADALIRVDMNEYGSEESTIGIVGDPDPSVTAQSFLTKQVQDNPFSLILLDEIEKAHPKVLNLFLQILDEGMLSDSRGVKTDFKNTIIIATSNAGALFIRDFIKENQQKSREDFKDALVDTILEQRIFTPEFVNRFDEVILYYPMTIENAIKVALLMLDGIVTDIEEKKGYKIRIAEDVIVEIVKQGYSIEFGAREMRRAILDIIENFLADYLLEHDVKRGDVIPIEKKDI
ncbi:MAG: AAA family ATPase [bacterium]|nr:AAA family ATPase [bacterium]